MEEREGVYGKGRVRFGVGNTDSLNEPEKMMSEWRLGRERRQCVYQGQHLRRTGERRRR